MGQTTLDSANKLLKEKKFKKAKQEFSEIIKNNRKSHMAFLGRGNCFYELKEYKLAIEDYSKAVELKNDFVKAYSNRAGTYYIMNDYQNAILDYSKIIELNPEDLASTYFLRGLCKSVLLKEDVVGACEDFKKAKSLGYSTVGLNGLNKYCNTTDLE